MNDYEQVLKIEDTEEDETASPPRHRIAWNYHYADPNSDWRNKKTPRFLHQDPTDPSRMYLLGRYYGTASIIKFNKNTFYNDYRLALKDRCWYDPGTTAPCNALPFIANSEPNAPMHDILSYVQPPQSGAIYACGFAWTEPKLETQYKKYASIFKMDTRSGEIIYMKSWGKPLTSADTTPTWYGSGAPNANI
jgi:hypothetical protein